MNNYNEFRQALDADLTSLLLLLPKEFSSQQFIGAVKELLHNEYSRILNGRSYRSVNVWLSRWYLQGLSESSVIVKIDRKKEVMTENRSKSHNQMWRKNETLD